jgi:hypothetical protein
MFSYTSTFNSVNVVHFFCRLRDIGTDFLRQKWLRDIGTDFYDEIVFDLISFVSNVISLLF